MRLTRALTAAVIFGGVAMASASPASAEEPLVGKYTYTKAGEPPVTWVIYPTCVPAGCVMHVAILEPGGNSYGGEARLVNDQWTFGANRANGLVCPDGSTAASSEMFTFDDATLTGTKTTMHAQACGMAPGMTKEPFALTYQAPLGIPVEEYPLQCPTWPQCDYSTTVG